MQRAAWRGSVRRFFAWWQAQSLVVLTAVLVALTAWLIIATNHLEAVISREGTTVQKEENIINRQASDSPPQVELVARVQPPPNASSAGSIEFRNQGNSYVHAAYAWCWVDDVLAFDINRPNVVLRASELKSITVHGDAILDFTSCSGEFGQQVSPHRPGSSTLTRSTKPLARFAKIASNGSSSQAMGAGTSAATRGLFRTTSHS